MGTFRSHWPNRHGPSATWHDLSSPISRSKISYLAHRLIQKSYLAHNVTASSQNHHSFSFAELTKNHAKINSLERNLEILGFGSWNRNSYFSESAYVSKITISYLALRALNTRITKWLISLRMEIEKFPVNNEQQHWKKYTGKQSSNYFRLNLPRRRSASCSVWFKVGDKLKHQEHGIEQSVSVNKQSSLLSISI